VTSIFGRFSGRGGHQLQSGGEDHEDGAASSIDDGASSFTILQQNTRSPA